MQLIRGEGGEEGQVTLITYRRVIRSYDLHIAIRILH